MPRDAGYVLKNSNQSNQWLIEITRHPSSRQITTYHVAWLLEGFRLASETKSKDRLLPEFSTLIFKAKRPQAGKEDSVIRLVQWILSGALAIGVGSALVDQTYKMAKAAVHAHQHDQMSYSKFTRAMTEAKPRQRTNPSSK